MSANDDWEDAPIDEIEEELPKSSWETTFADLSLLLLVFFILLFSMSELDEKRFTNSFQSVKSALSGKSGEFASFKVSPDQQGVLLDQVMIRRQMLESQQKIYAEIQYYQNTQGLEGIVGSHFDKGIITLNVPSDVMFAPGDAQVGNHGKQILSGMVDFFIKHPDQTINIRGFSDDLVPGPSSRFRDNWELSSMRAVNVLRFLIEQGIEPDRMTATGLANLKPLYPNNSPENRARNRRIEFALEKHMGD